MSINDYGDDVYDFNEDDYFDDNGDGYDNDDVGPDNSVCAFSHQKNYFCTKLRLFSQLRLLWQLLFTNIPLLFFNCLLMFCRYSPKLSLFIILFQLDSFSLLERCRFLLGSCIFLLLQGEDFFYIARWRFEWNFDANKSWWRQLEQKKWPHSLLNCK